MFIRIRNVYVNLYHVDKIVIESPDAARLDVAGGSIRVDGPAAVSQLIEACNSCCTTTTQVGELNRMTELVEEHDDSDKAIDSEE